MNTNKKDVKKIFLNNVPPTEAKKVAGKKALRRNKAKPIRHIKDPVIEPYTVGTTDIVYYRYRRGTSCPIHLGTPEYILKLVLEDRKKKLIKGS